MAKILEEGPIRRMLKERRILRHSPEISGEFTLSQIDMRIRDIQGLIEDENKADREYRTLAQDPVIRVIDGNTILLQIADDEKRHAKLLEPLLPKLKEKWEEVYRKLV